MPAGRRRQGRLRSQQPGPVSSLFLALIFAWVEVIRAYNKAKKSWPDARLYHFYAAKAVSVAVTIWALWMLLFGGLRWQVLAFAVAIAWLWANRTARALTETHTFFGLPFIRHRKSRAFAWLQAVNHAVRGAPLRSAPAGDRPAASADGRPSSLDG
jgi:hypothetical protein